MKPALHGLPSLGIALAIGACAPIPLGASRPPAAAATAATPSPIASPVVATASLSVRDLVGAIEGDVIAQTTVGTASVTVDPRPDAQIALIDPATDHLVAAGGADGFGNFVVAPGPSFAPAIGADYFLQSSVPSFPGDPLFGELSLRTVVQWTGNGWTAIATGSGGITISSWTTAVAALGQWDPNVGLPETIGKVVADTPSNLTVTRTASFVAQVRSWCVALYSRGIDPVNRLTSFGTVNIAGGNPSNDGYMDGLYPNNAMHDCTAIALDPQGNMYVTNSASIREITPGNAISTLADPGGTSGYLDGATSSAEFRNPRGIADYGGTIYVADRDNSVIRTISGGSVSTLAGQAGKAGYADGAGTAAQFNQPWGMVADAQGNLYVADANNGVVRKVTPGGLVSTYAGSITGGTVDGPASSVKFQYPVDVALDAQGNLYEAEWNGNIIRKITPQGMAVTVAGNGIYGEADGPALQSEFSTIRSIALDPIDGDLYILDNNGYEGGYATLRVLHGGWVRTLASSTWWDWWGSISGGGFNFDYETQPTPLAMLDPYWDDEQIRFDSAGNLYIATFRIVRKMTPG